MTRATSSNTAANAANPSIVTTAVLLTLWAATAGAVTWVVTSTSDADTTNGDCTIREALYAATYNTGRDNCAAGSPTESDRIIINTSSSINFDGGQFVVNDVQGGPLHIQGATSDPSDSVISLGFNSRFLYLLNSDQVTLEDLTVYFGDEGSDSASWGGAIRATSTDFILGNVELNLNQARLGGALYFNVLSGTHKLVIEDSVFNSNQTEGAAATGGGLWAAMAGSGYIRITNTTFSANSATPSDVASSYGGGAWIEASDQVTVTITGSTFTENNATSDRFNAGGLGLSLLDTASATIRDCTFTGNTTTVPSLTGYTQYPGAHVITDGTVVFDMDRCTFTDNLCTNDDGSHQIAVYVQTDTSAVLSNLLITGGHWGAFGYSDGTSTLAVSNLTVTENERSVWMSTGAGGECRLYNSMCADNDLDLLTMNGASMALDVYTGTTPMFADPTSGDYSLQSGSPGVNAGNQTRPGTRFCDLDHGPRIEDSEIDLGAYERNGLFADDFESGDTSVWSLTVD